jgi:hypothetical protein
MCIGANNGVETPPVLIKKPVADLKKDLQNYEAARK